MSTAITHAEKPFMVFWLMTMTLLGVFPLDVVLPSFPALAEHFHTSTTHIARSVSLFAIGFSCSMLLIGPLSDRIGRKKLLQASMVVAIMGAAGCLASSNTSQFLFFASSKPWAAAVSYCPKRWFRTFFPVKSESGCA